MKQDYYSLNITALKKYNPLLAEEITNNSDDDIEKKIIIEETPSGHITMSLDGIYVHSKRDPYNEAKRIAAAMEEGDNPIILLGFGLGFSALSISEQFPHRPIIVVEKHKEILKKALHVMDHSTLITHTHLIFIIGGTGESISAAMSIFQKMTNAAPLLVKNRALCSIDEQWYKQVEAYIRSHITRANVNKATQKRFGERWVKNLAKNLNSIKDFPGISHMEGILSEKNIPVFLAAACPTLDSIKPHIKEIHKKALIVAVDTSLRFLLAENIVPDFVVSVDPQYWNFRHLDRTDRKGLCLVTESAVYPPCLRKNYDKILLSSSFFPLGLFIEKQVDVKGELGAGGSVATSAWDFSRSLGADNIWIAGLDLSFPQLKTHFKGALFEEKSHAETKRFSPGESWNFRALRDGQPFLAKRQGGGEVLSDKRLSLYSTWFENRFALYPQIKSYTASDEGLAIKGLESKPLEDLLSLGDKRKEIDMLLKEAYDKIDCDFYSGEKIENRQINFNNAVNDLLQGLNKIKSVAMDAAENAEKAYSRSKKGLLDDKDRERILLKLEKANGEISSSRVKDIAGFLFPYTENWEEEITKSENGNKLNGHLLFSCRLYRALFKATCFTVDSILPIIT